MLELLEGAENGRYKVVAKAEPYKNLPVSINTIFYFIMIKTFIRSFLQPAPVTPDYQVTPPGDSQFLYDWGGRFQQ